VCIVKLHDICKCLLLGQECISQSNIVYDHFHIHTVVEWMMDPRNVNVCVRNGWHMVAQLVEALRYKLEGGGFDA
jgi:hypothetical protein